MISWQNLVALALEGSNYLSLHFTYESARPEFSPRVPRLVRHSSLIDDGDDHRRKRLLFSYSAKVHFPIALRSEPGRQMYVIRETTMRATHSLARSLARSFRVVRDLRTFSSGKVGGTLLARTSAAVLLGNECSK